MGYVNNDTILDDIFWLGNGWTTTRSDSWCNDTQGRLTDPINFDEVDIKTYAQQQQSNERLVEHGRGRIRELSLLYTMIRLASWATGCPHGVAAPINEARIWPFHTISNYMYVLDVRKYDVGKLGRHGTVPAGANRS